MIEISCQSCGEKNGVNSFLAAAQQPCRRCGRLLMGPVGSGGNSSWVPSRTDEAAPAWQEPSAGSSGGMWVGVVMGVVAGVGIVAAVAHFGPLMPLQLRGATLGALSGVLLAPILIVSSFVSMLVLPFSIEGLIGGSVWERIARANNEKNFGPLVWPFLYLLVLPMGLCAFGGSRMAEPNALVAVAGLGAVMLGAMIGGACGVVIGKPRSVTSL